jgi:hypothetical protein
MLYATDKLNHIQVLIFIFLSKHTGQSWQAIKATPHYEKPQTEEGI